MKKELVFATHNNNKLAEIQQMLQNHYFLKGLNDMGLTEEIPENENTLAGNALSKAKYVFDKTGLNCFADDTGLEVEALNGEPGVYSARYAGPENSAEKNMNKLLANLEQKASRNAAFKTVIALILDGKHYFFEGKVEGTITSEKLGANGFGYDPIFKPNGFDKTFAEMSMAEKAPISHRGKAVKKLIDFLKNQ